MIYVIMQFLLRCPDTCHDQCVRTRVYVCMTRTFVMHGPLQFHKILLSSKSTVYHMTRMPMMTTMAMQLPTLHAKTTKSVWLNRGQGQASLQIMKTTTIGQKY